MPYKLHCERKHRKAYGGRGKALPNGDAAPTVEKGVPHGRQLTGRYVDPDGAKTLMAPRTSSGRPVRVLDVDVPRNAAQRLLDRIGVPYSPSLGGRTEHLHATRGWSGRRA